MNILPKEYTFLFNTLSDTEEALNRLRAELMDAQCRAEELFLEGDGREAGVPDPKRTRKNLS